jgi:hypothetical protein
MTSCFNIQRLLVLSVLSIMMAKVNRDWDELPCPECGALQVVITQDKGLYIPGRCKACGKDVTFERDPWNYGRFLERIKAHRELDAKNPADRK